MTTTASAFARVATTLAGIDCADEAAVDHFYRRTFTAYPESVRALISDFLTGLPNPTDEDLAKLKQAVSLPPDQIPTPASPEWDPRFGLQMNNEPANLPQAATA